MIDNKLKFLQKLNKANEQFCKIASKYDYCTYIPCEIQFDTNDNLLFKYLNKFSIKTIIQILSDFEDLSYVENSKNTNKKSIILNNNNLNKLLYYLIQEAFPLNDDLCDCSELLDPDDRDRKVIITKDKLFYIITFNKSFEEEEKESIKEFLVSSNKWKWFEFKFEYK